MKLMIVDDEELTRKGVIASIDWNKLGISQVLEAEDGLQGLQKARMFKPDIILSDVRMPRMDGISMAAELEKELPDTSVIFMSGYSDKEYLMAAIRLQAVHYVEKPIQPEEIADAVLKARQQVNQKISSRLAASIHNRETGSRLARLLTEPREDHREESEQLIARLGLPGGESSAFLCCCARIDPEHEQLLPAPAQICLTLEKALPAVSAQCLHTVRKSVYQVFFLLTDAPLSSSEAERINRFFREAYVGAGRYYLATGEPAAGLDRSYVSYMTLFTALQHAYFFPEGTCIDHSSGNLFQTAAAENAQANADRSIFPEMADLQLADYLKTNQSEKCFRLLGDIYNFFSRNSQVLPQQVVDLYYNLYRVLDRWKSSCGLSDGQNLKKTPISELQLCFSYDELHQGLITDLDEAFHWLPQKNTDQPVIRQIKDFISENYGNEALSVKDIAEQASLSASYVCTFFKNETGLTLNQYLTDYRMEKARQLLLNSRYSITDISGIVGYRDGNYFAKSFRRHTGLSPTEFREKNTAESLP